MLSLTHSHIAVYRWFCSLSVVQSMTTYNTNENGAHCTQRPLFVSFAIDGVRVDLFGRGHTIPLKRLPCLRHMDSILILTHAYEHTYTLIQQMSASRRQYAEPICLLEPPDKHTHTHAPSRKTQFIFRLLCERLHTSA